MKEPVIKVILYKSFQFLGIPPKGDEVEAVSHSRIAHIVSNF